MQFQIWCDCNSMFFVDIPRLLEKEKLQCPNCEKIYSQELLRKLKTMGTTLDEHSCNTSNSDNVAVQISGYVLTR
ncbi:hypothetical protein CN936_25735 [Bacillus cereus]|uniref:hypothetical protein n=1 Tax=Bacillus cereus group TaxID=86661 RepID=UPI000BF5F38E|nr:MULTISPECIES: hypothetical protein [Bacillus cereus group]PFF00456.1 hypothetical protein CN321_01070 [Bacillus thuringiensis]PFR72899.1 hypothetical protein COK29_22290 [Bacillus cereus]PGL90844.1 hypothetical protein CN936_25735 [Bacillus cereus]